MASLAEPKYDLPTATTPIERERERRLDYMNNKEREGGGREQGNPILRKC